MIKKTDNKTLSKAVRIIAENISEESEAIGFSDDLLSGALNEAADRIAELDAAIIETIEDNLDLADGDNCTLIKLKKAIGYE